MFGQILGIIWRVIIVIVSCYLAISILIYFIKPRKLSFDTPDSYTSKILRLSLRPIMDLGFDNRLSLDFDWQEYKLDSYRQKEKDAELLKTSNGNENNFNDFMSVSWYDLGNPAQSVILEPQNLAQNKTWFLIRCIEKSNILYCQKNNITLSGKVKTSVFRAEQAYLGVDKEGNFIKLKNDQTIKTDQRKDLIFI